MFCKECGTQLESSATFCKNCGSPQPVKINIETESLTDESIIETEKVSIEEQNEVIRKHKIFFNSDETLIDTLGSGFISSLFVQESFSKSVLFCSNKRIYQRGKLFDRNFQGKITYYNGERSVDLREITGMSYYVDDPIHRFKLIAPAFLFGIIGFLIASEQRGDLKDIISIISGAFIGIGIVSLIIYGLKKAKWFVIEYAGGMIMTNCNWYSKKSIKRFMRNIAIQKDKLFT
ncbi:MAG: zinc ribbon domain-containing protein [Candidatus Delongbacteria bacterium]|nr:zinc ribbon domain-containing protein [Candidatus Delongbacteria bacterium]